MNKTRTTIAAALMAVAAFPQAAHAATAPTRPCTHPFGVIWVYNNDTPHNETMLFDSQQLQPPLFPSASGSETDIGAVYPASLTYTREQLYVLGGRGLIGVYSGMVSAPKCGSTTRVILTARG